MILLKDIDYTQTFITFKIMIEKEFVIFHKGVKTNLKFVFLYLEKNDINDKFGEMKVLDNKVSKILNNGEKQEFIDVRQNIPWMRVIIVGNLDELVYETKNNVEICKCYIDNNNIISDLIFMRGTISIPTPNIYMSQISNMYKENNDMFELIDRHLDNPWLRLLWFNPIYTRC